MVLGPTRNDRRLCVDWRTQGGVWHVGWHSRGSEHVLRSNVRNLENAGLSVMGGPCVGLDEAEELAGGFQPMLLAENPLPSLRQES